MRLGLMVLLGLMVSPSAYAFRCTRVPPNQGPSLAWPKRTISWWMDRSVAQVSGGGGASQVLAAFDAWSGPSCSDLDFRFEGTRTDLVSAFSEGGLNRNVVVLLNPWPHDEATIGLTTLAFDTLTGEILDGDIELNAEYFEVTIVDPSSCSSDRRTMDLRNTLTHEVGHLIGLDHPPVAERYEATTMFGSAPPCETRKRTLEQDDIDGLCAIYPAGQPNEPCFFGAAPSYRVVEEDAGFGCQASSTPAGSLALLLGALALGIARRRRP